MFERSLVLWKLQASQIPASSGDVAALRLSFEDHPQLLDLVGADRHIVSHAMTPMPGGDFLLSLFLERR